MKKTVHYRRALWIDQQPTTLGDLFDNAFEHLDNNSLPTFAIDGHYDCLLARSSLINGARFMHFVTYEEGAPVAVINRQIQAGAVDADEQDPNGANEFIHSQLFCLLAGDDIIWANHNEALRQGKIERLLSSFAIYRGIASEDVQFGFQVVLDQEVVQQALEEGIQEIDLNIGSLQPTLERIADGGELPEEGFLARLGSIFQQPPDAAEIDAASQIEGKLILRAGRDWNEPVVRQLLVSMSNGVQNNYEDEFAIVTKRGLRLTRDKMSLKRDCEVGGNRRVVDSTQMEIAMRSVLQELRDADIVNE